MAAGNAPIKTPEGQAELATRARRVSQRHRTMLFLVDGRRSQAQIKNLAEQAGVPAGCFEELLAMGLIEHPQPTLPLSAMPDDTPPAPLHIDLPLPDVDESVLPPVRSLQPESTLNGDLGAAEPWKAVETNYGDLGDFDPGVEEARDLLIRAIRADAPVAGSLTLMRLRRARTRADLEELLDEAETRLRKPHRMLATTLLMRRVRQLLGLPADLPMSAS